jgi:hypothetical protein
VRVAFALACAAPLAVMVASCTFPSVTFGDASVPLPEAGDDATSEAAAEAGDPCDKDNDGHKAMGSCGGDDCNDDDSRVHPGQNFLTDVPDGAPYPSGPLGDWDCSGTVEYQTPTAVCSVTCSNSQGFAQAEGCGITGAYVTCAVVVTCSTADAGTRTQGCR